MCTHRYIAQGDPLLAKHLSQLRHAGFECMTSFHVPGGERYTDLVSIEADLYVQRAQMGRVQMQLRRLHATLHKIKDLLRGLAGKTF